jgi:hypothetical protein
VTLPASKFEAQLSSAGGHQSLPEMKAMFEYFNETQVFDGLTERVRAYMRTYDLDLDDISVLLQSEPQHIADWLIGAAPRPQSVHTLLFSNGRPSGGGAALGGSKNQPVNVPLRFSAPSKQFPCCAELG